MLKDKFLYIGLFFLVLGIFVSVSIPSLFHILAAIPLILYFKDNFKALNFPKSAILLICFLIWGYISNIFNVDDLNNVGKSFGKQKYIIFSLLSLFSFPFFFKAYMTKRRISFLIKTFVFTIVAASIIGALKSRFGFDLLHFEWVRPTGRSAGLTQIMRYGYGTGIVLSIFLGLALYKNKIQSIIPYKWIISGTVFAMIGLFETKCRGAILGTFCSLPFILYFKNKTVGLVTFILASLAIIGTVFIIFNGGSKSSRVFTKLSAASNLIRLSQYEAAFTGAKENPILGVGINQFSSECKDIKKRNNIDWRNYCTEFNLECDNGYSKPYCNHAHNIFLETAANTGFIGLIFFTLWLLFWLFEMFKRKDLWGYIMIPFIINLLIAGQFEYIFDANNSFLIFLIYPLSFLKKEHLNFSLD